MPKRQALITYTAEDVQGDGAFVKMREMTYGQGKKLAKDIAKLEAELKAAKEAGDKKKAEKLEGETYRMNDDLLIGHIVEWNWVDDDDKPLPRPKDKPEVLDQLTMSEIKFLSGLLQGDGERKK